MRVFVFFALLAFALTATFHIEETKEEVNLESIVDIERALQCIKALGGTAECLNAVRIALYNHDLGAALNALMVCQRVAKEIYNKCYSLVVKAVS